MTDILLITDNSKNINMVWRHFNTKEYNASAAINSSAAMEQLVNAKKMMIPVFYCSNSTKCFIEFYRMLRSNPKTADVPLVVLADFKWTKVLSEYVHLVNTRVVGATISDSLLNDIMKTAAKGGFEKKSPQRPSFQQKSSSQNPRASFQRPAPSPRPSGFGSRYGGNSGSSGNNGNSGNSGRSGGNY